MDIHFFRGVLYLVALGVRSRLHWGARIRWPQMSDPSGNFRDFLVNRGPWIVVMTKGTIVESANNCLLKEGALGISSVMSISTKVLD